MNVIFKNSFGAQVQIIIAYADMTCPGEDNNQKFHAMGWYILDPGQSRQLFSTNAPFFYYYAEDTLGLGRKWSGQDEFLHIVRRGPINQCLNIVPPGSETIGLIQISELSANTYEVNLTS